MIPGIIIGIVGIVGVISAYSLYNHITKKQREKLAPEIIRLTDEFITFIFHFPIVFIEIFLYTLVRKIYKK